MLMLAGCGSDADDLPATATASTVAKAATSTAVSTTAKPAEFTVTGSEYKFEVSGTPVPGSDLVTFKNSGKELHHLQLIQLAPGKGLQDVMAVLSAPQLDLSQVPGKFVGGVGQLAPNGSGVLQAKLVAGNYAMLCFIEGADNAPHFTKGMSGSFEVKGAENTAVFEGAPAKISAADYAFTAPETLKAGKVVLELTNAGKEPHEANIVKLNEGVTLEQALQAAQGGGVPPITPMGGPQAILPTDTTKVEATLDKGNYALVCFVPNAEGTPHVFLGMARPIKVE